MRTFSVVGLLAAIVGVVLLVRPGHSVAAHRERDCVILDVSGSTKGQWQARYRGGFERLANEAVERGSGEVCAMVAAGNVQGGDAQWAHFAPRPEASALESQLEVKHEITAATAQLGELAEHPHVQLTGSDLLEAIGVLAPSLSPGDRIMVCSDAIQNGQLIGNFTYHSVDMSATGIEAILRTLAENRLLPDMHGITLLIPWALEDRYALNIHADRLEAIRAFWEAYATRTGARLVWSGGVKAV